MAHEQHPVAAGHADEHRKPHGSEPLVPSAHHDDDTTTLFGRTLPFPVYTVVFGVLGVATLTEVLIAETVTVDWLKVPLLVGLALFKAALVVLFYMHLREDSRFFAVALIVPLAVALLSMLYLLGVPPTGY